MDLQGITSAQSHGIILAPFRCRQVLYPQTTLETVKQIYRLLFSMNLGGILYEELPG